MSQNVYIPVPTWKRLREKALETLEAISNDANAPAADRVKAAELLMKYAHEKTAEG